MAAYPTSSLGPGGKEANDAAERRRQGDALERIAAALEKIAHDAYNRRYS